MFVFASIVAGSTIMMPVLFFTSRYGDEMIAADFGHPTANGRSLYVATRFFARDPPELRQLMPGFLLALAEGAVLKQCGCELWDLGGM